MPLKLLCTLLDNPGLVQGLHTPWSHSGLHIAAIVLHAAALQARCSSLAAQVPDPGRLSCPPLPARPAPSFTSCTLVSTAGGRPRSSTFLLASSQPELDIFMASAYACRHGCGLLRPLHAKIPIKPACRMHERMHRAGRQPLSVVAAGT